MAITKGQKGFLDINNGTLALEELQTLYKNAYASNLGIDQLFDFRDAKKFGLFFKKKKMPKYKTGDGTLFNTDIIEDPKSENKLFKYSKVEITEDTVELSKVVQFARRIDPIEESFLDSSIVSAEIGDLVDIEIMQKRKLIMEKIQQTDGNGATPQYVDADPRKDPLIFHDAMIDYCDEYGINKNKLVVLASMEIIRGIRDKLQLSIGASPEVQNVLNSEQPLTGAMKSLEGITYLGIPNKTTFVNESGNRESVSLLKENVQLIAFEINDRYSSFIARKKEHTPLRSGPAGIGTGLGNTIIIEKMTVYGFDIIEPMRIVQVIKGKSPEEVDSKKITTSNNEDETKAKELEQKEKELEQKEKELEQKKQELEKLEQDLLDESNASEGDEEDSD